MPNIQKIHPKIGPSTATQSLEQPLEGAEIEGIGVCSILGDLIEIRWHFQKEIQGG